MGNKKGVKESAFSGHQTIFSAHFGSDCDYIGSNAFDECSSLIEINDDNCITEIGANAFSKTGISHATFKKLTNISESSFEDCVNLESIDIPECTNIEKNAFIRTGISHATFKKLTEIGESAFEDCVNLKSIDIPFCSKIGANAFNGCKNISQISLLNCDKISNGGFFNCENLKKVYIYSDSCELEENVFYKGEGDNTSIIDGIVFYFKPNMYSEYLKDTTWEPYIDHMVTMADEKNIIYKSTTGDKIEIINNLNNINTNEYNICGILNFNEHITSLGKIFSSPYQLADIDLPPTCVEIKEHAFEGCSNLTNITLPEDLETIGEYAFKGCSEFTTITIPQCVTTLGEGIFAGCSKLKTFYGNFTTYGEKAIVYKDTLICVSPIDDSKIHKISDIDPKIKILGKQCFNGCKDMMRIDISVDVTEIHDGAFDGCKNLCEVHFKGNTPPTFGKDVFKDVNEDCKIFVPIDSFDNYCEALSSYNNIIIYPMPKNTDIIYYCNDKYHVIQNNSDTTTDNYFNNIAENVTTVIVGNGIKKIGSSTFKGCNSLKYIYLPDTITEFNNRCFYNCSSITKIHIPSSLCENNKFGDESFYGCSKLVKFETYVNGHVSADGRCYMFNNKLIYFASGGLENENDYKIPDNITEINKYAFCGTNITGIDLNKITAIGKGAFSGCVGIKEINLPTNLTTLGDNAFYDCTSLTNISLGNIEKINENTFYNCTALKSVDLNNITTIGKSAFKNCKCLENINNLGNIKEINESAFENCALLNIDISSAKNLQTIGNAAFKKCVNLSSTIKLPNKVQSIGDSAFFECSNITTIKLSANLKSIGDNALYTRSTNPIEVYVHRATTTPPKISVENRKGPFGSSTLNIGTIYIPNDIKKTYMDYDGWKTYIRKIKGIDVDVLENYIYEIKHTVINSIQISFVNLPEEWKNQTIYFEAYNSIYDDSKYSSSFTIPKETSLGSTTIIQLVGINNLNSINYIKIVNVDNVDIMYSGENIKIS